MARDYTLGFGVANAYAALLVIPTGALYIVPYGWWYGWSVLGEDLVQFLASFPLFLVSIVLGTIAHEFIHAVSWWSLDDIPWERIHFGFKWEMLTPYVHCPDPIEVQNYRWGVAMPGILLGIIPYLLALLIQSGWLLGFGLFFTLAAGGDILILWLLRNVAAGKLVEDHPELIGCRVLNRNELNIDNE